MEIDAGRKLLTLVIVMHVDPDVIDDRIRTIREQARIYSARPGFVSCSIHRSIDNTQIVEYIQWESLAHLQAVARDVNDVHPAGFANSIDVSVVDVVDVIDPTTN